MMTTMLVGKCKVISSSIKLDVCECQLGLTVSRCSVILLNCYELCVNFSFMRLLVKFVIVLDMRGLFGKLFLSFKMDVATSFSLTLPVFVGSEACAKN